MSTLVQLSFLTGHMTTQHFVVLLVLLLGLTSILKILKIIIIKEGGKERKHDFNWKW